MDSPLLWLTRPGSSSTVTGRAVGKAIRWYGEAIDKVVDELPNVASNALAFTMRSSRRSL